jgi:sec-independent protein translocase protein TatA
MDEIYRTEEFSMPVSLGAPELLILLTIIILLFGVGRISKISGELGRGISSFRKGLQEQPVEEENFLDKPR